jgi:hypothetical protein
MDVSMHPINKNFIYFFRNLIWETSIKCYQAIPHGTWVSTENFPNIFPPTQGSKDQSAERQDGYSFQSFEPICMYSFFLSNSMDGKGGPLIARACLQSQDFMITF